MTGETLAAIKKVLTMFNPKPCPLCGGAKLEAWRTLIPRQLWRYRIVCVTCYYCGRKAITRLGAIWKWNQ